MSYTTLVNLGGIKKPTDIPIFLFNMFNDRFILNIPQPLRFFLAFAITTLRAKETYKILKQTPSTLEETTKKQTEKLKNIYKKNVNYVFSYTKPKLKKAEISLPMFCFFSKTTHGKILSLSKKTLPPFFIYLEFVDMLLIRLKRFEKLKNCAVLFSAHSIPLKYSKTDSYDKDLDRFRLLLNNLLKLPVFLSFQSKLGPVKWLEPSTSSAIKQLSKFYSCLIIVPISFCSDNTETINEIDIIYKKEAFESGFKIFHRIPCFNDDADFIKLMSKIIP
ncbi:ferrochelatase [Hippea jasoniae]|uniref:ferrochelatase n=1 Tax=Hippea jasoniae TaxID=944479 RepID=UPI00054D629D|nr:ferrochelatase [Hippea jasoniae]